SFGALAPVLNQTNTLSQVLGTQTRAAVIHPLNPEDSVLNGQITTEDQLELIDRGDRSLTELPDANRGQALVAGGVNSSNQIRGSAFVVASSSATLTTDKSDYVPGEVVTIIGTGWQAGETVSIGAHETDLDSMATTSVADASGNFTNIAIT